MDSEFLAGLGGDPADEQAAFVQHAAPAPAGEVYDNLWIVENDRIWDLGPADVDTDADGIADSLTRPGPDGLTVYTDSDRDGQVDLITEVPDVFAVGGLTMGADPIASAVLHQGVAMGRPSRLEAAVEGDRVRVSGGCVVLGTGRLRLT